MAPGDGARSARRESGERAARHAPHAAPPASLPLPDSPQWVLSDAFAWDDDELVRWRAAARREVVPSPHPLGWAGRAVALSAARGGRTHPTRNARAR